MKSYLFSIKPNWCEYIAEGLKEDEIRKTAPKEVPFKGYIYCTLDGGTKGDTIFTRCGDAIVTCGMVIGEFICNSVTDIVPDGNGFYTFAKGDEETSCLTIGELNAYLQNHRGKCIGMSDVVIYDKPKDLSDFLIPTDGTEDCCDHHTSGKHSYCYGCRFFSRGNDSAGVEDDCYASFDTTYFRPLRHAPQSWCRVVTVEEAEEK